MKTFKCIVWCLFKFSLLLGAAWIVVRSDAIQPSKTVAYQDERAKCELSESEKKLFDAIEKGDLKQVEALLTAGANPDGRVKVSENNYERVKLCPSPFLMHALRLGRMEILKQLLKASHAKDTDRNQSPGLGDERYVIEMLLAGGDANTKTENGTTHLMIAARGGRVDLVRYLLENGAQVDARNFPKETALIAAANRQGDPNGYSPVISPLHTDKDEVVKVLVAAGADINASDANGDTPLILASRYGRIEVVRFLIESGAALNHRNRAGETALLAAIGILGYYVTNETDKGKIIELLIGAGADVNTRNLDGDTPLIIVANAGRVSHVRLLLEHGADVHLQNRGGGTALTAASAPGGSGDVNVSKARIINLLVQANADINIKDREGNTPLISAARSAWYFDVPDTIIKALISSGADVNARNDRGDTALIEAVKNRGREYTSYGFGSNDQRNIVKAINILMAGRAEINAENHHGETALKIAIMRSSRDNLGVLQALLAHKADVNITGSVKEPALILAIRRSAGRSNGELVQALIKAGGNVRITDDEGTPALIVAVRESGSPEVVRLLLQAGARVNDRDKNGETALLAAVREYLPSETESAKNALRRNPEVIRSLLVAGADVTTKGRDGLTTLEIATKTNRTDLIQLLRKAGTK
jgi:ankyrin repeat protein